MAPALVYIAAWSVIIICNICRKGAVGTPLSPLVELKFTNEPQDVVALKGTSATLHCSALSGNEVANISWLKDGQQIPNSKRFRTNQNGVLVLWKYAPRRHAGEYQCIAANQFGRIISQPAYVETAYLGKIRHGPISTSSFAGDNVRLLCVVEGNPVPTIKWQKNGQPLVESDGVAVYETKVPVVKDNRHSHGVLKSGILQLSGVATDDMGQYRCVVTNKADSINSSEAALIVNASSQGNYEQPIVLSPSINYTKVNGTSVVFECFASGRPTPALRWLKDGKAVPLNTMGYVLEKGSNLRLKNIQYQHTGHYTCEASTVSPKSTATKSSRLAVIIKPILESEVKPIYGRPQSSNVRFTCIFNGYPEPRVRWFINGKEMHEDDRISFQQQGTTMIISKSKTSDSGYVQCWGINEAGRTTAETSLSILPPGVDAPDPPIQLVARTVSTTVIELSWESAPVKNGKKNIAYSVHCVPTNGAPETQTVEQSSPVLVEHLKPGINYTLYVIAYNGDGASEESKRVTQVTLPMSDGGDNGETSSPTLAPLHSPSGVQVFVINSTAVTIKWSYDGIVDGNSWTFTVRYREQAKKTDKSHFGLESREKLKEGTVNVKSSPAVIGGLKPYTDYLLDVRAEVDKLHGPFSEAIRRSMPEATPSPPIDLKIDQSDKGPYVTMLYWKKPLHCHGILKYFVIYYTMDETLPIEQWNTIIKNGSAKEAVIQGLQRNQIYYFKIAAVTNAGEGAKTPIQTIQTTTSQPSRWFNDKDKGILVGVAIGGICIIICVIIIVLRNKCCTHNNSNESSNTNGRIPNMNGNPPGGLVHHVECNFHEMDSFTPMLSPQVPFNHECDTKGGYDTYPRIERSRFLKSLNGFTNGNGGRTRTVSSGYTSDRDLDHIDDGIHVHTQSEGEPTDPISVDIAHLEDLEDNHSSHGIDSFSNTSNTQRSSWPSRCGSTSGSQDSNKDSGTGTECFGGPSNGEHSGSCHTLTGCVNMVQSVSSPCHPDEEGNHSVQNLLPNSTSTTTATTNQSSNLKHHNHLNYIQGRHGGGDDDLGNSVKPNCNHTYGERELASQNCETNLPVANNALSSPYKDSCLPYHYGAQPAPVQQHNRKKAKDHCMENGTAGSKNKGVHSQGKLLPQDIVQEYSSTSLPLLGTQDFSRTGVS